MYSYLVSWNRLYAAKRNLLASKFLPGYYKQVLVAWCWFMRTGPRLVHHISHTGTLALVLWHSYLDWFGCSLFEAEGVLGPRHTVYCMDLLIVV